MTRPMTTVPLLIEALDALDPDMPLGFATPEGEIGGGYHVTELKHASVRSIDCGGRQDGWTEAQLQLLDGSGGEWLTAGKLAGILGRSLSALPDLAEAPLSVEFAHGNRALSLYALSAPEHHSGRALIGLTPLNAACKPALAAVSVVSAAASGCCGPAPRAACCG